MTETIVTKIQKIQNSISEAYSKCEDKGADMPTEQKVENLAECIYSIKQKAEPVLQEKTVIPNKTVQCVTPSYNYDGLSKVVVNKIPDEYIIPNFNMLIVDPQVFSQDVTPEKFGYDGFSRVLVNPIPDKYIIPNGVISISSNGTYDVKNFAEASVEVVPNLQTKSVTPSKSAQTVKPDGGYDGLSQVSVGAIPSEFITPSGTLNITSNGTHNVTNYASANVNIPVLNPLMHVTQADSGSFTPSSDVAMNGYSIPIKFKPKFFIIYNTDAIKNPASGTTGNSTNYYLQMTHILTDDNYNRLSRGGVFVSFLRESSTNYGRGGIGTSAYPAVTDLGVTLTTSLSNLKLKGGVPYSWHAWG